LPSTDDTPFVNTRPRVRIDGQDRPELGAAVVALGVHRPASGMACAELRAINWGQTGNPQPGFAFQDIRLGSRIDITLGQTTTQPAFTGDITALEERYGDGAPQIVLLAEDACHRLARRRDSRAFTQMSLADVVRQIADEAGLAADVQLDEFQATWLQHNESALAFLLRLLGPRDVPLRLQAGVLRARPEETDPDPVTLDPGHNALRVRLIADLNHQPREVITTGQDLDADAPVEARADRLTPAPSGTTAADTLADLGWDGRSPRPHPPVRHQADAESLARSQFRATAGRFLHGDIVCTGTPDLASGREVVLTGVSPRLAGRYRVADCRHHFDNTQGLSTRLQVQRADWQP
jgi:phage protein D